MRIRRLPYALIILILLYGRICHQQLYFSSSEAKPDKRAVKLQKYLYAKGSTMAKDASFLIKTCDSSGLDYRLLVAIAGVESNFEKSGNTTDNNPFGIMSNSRPMVFKSMQEAILYESRLLSTSHYYTSFRKTNSILELAKVYTANPPDWTSKVLYFESSIDNFK